MFCSHDSVNKTNCTSTTGSGSNCGGRDHGHSSSHGGHGHDDDPIQNSNHISLPQELWLSLGDSAKDTITQHNCQYQDNTTQQENVGCIPKALWEQLLRLQFLVPNMANNKPIIWLGPTI